eukprot:scaffold142485_cov33-Tisochrysis_lutea.AAC.2
MNSTCPRPCRDGPGSHRLVVPCTSQWLPRASASGPGSPSRRAPLVRCTCGRTAKRDEQQSRPRSDVKEAQRAREAAKQAHDAQASW